MGAHFTEAGLKFLRGIKRNNERDWFNARKEIYERELKAPMLAVIAEVNDSLPPEFVRDPAKTMMRIYRDTRFSKEKVPYKTHIAAWWALRGMEKTSGGGYYLHVSATSVEVAGGCFMPQREQLLAIRRHLVDVHADYRTILKSKKLRDAGMQPIERAMMTRPPKGFAAEDPAIDLIMQRQWGVSASLPTTVALGPNLVQEVTKRFLLASPLVNLLNEPMQRTESNRVFPEDFS